MGILNATPDSFSDGKPSHTLSTLLASAQTLVEAGADILDVGGLSTRPQAIEISESEEIDRVVPLIAAIRGALSVPISIDTYRPGVARAAIDAGAHMINDVRGGRTPGMLDTMVELDVPVILMHSRGDSTTMLSPSLQAYDDIVSDVRSELLQSVHSALEAGVKGWNILVDPGIGFAKSASQSLELLRRLDEVDVGLPLVVGASRKSFIGRVIGEDIPSERGLGDAVLSAWCVDAGVLRVHDVKGARQAVQMAKALRGEAP